MSVAAGRPLIQGAVIANALGIPPRGRRSCHSSRSDQTSRHPPGHWQSPSTTTTVAHALSMERSAQFLALQPEEHTRWMSRSRRMRMRAQAERHAEAAAAAEASQAVPAAQLAGSQPPPAAHQSRNGSPGAGSSDAGAAPPGAAPPGTAAGGIGAATAEAQVAQLRAELQEMRQIVTAQAALTAQQQLTISSLQRSLQSTPSGSGPPPVGTQSARRSPIALIKP